MDEDKIGRSMKLQEKKLKYQILACLTLNRQSAKQETIQTYTQITQFTKLNSI
jgi:hypothetical protein